MRPLWLPEGRARPDYLANPQWFKAPHKLNDAIDDACSVERFRPSIIGRIVRWLWGTKQ